MDTRFELNFYSFYNVTGMRLHLEDMARRGWFLERINTWGRYYRRGEPRNLHYAVSYYTKASLFEPEPSEGQQTFQDFCAHSGWKLAAGDAKLQIFCNEAEDPVPIYTDPESELEAIRQISRQQLVIYWVMLALLGVQLLLQFTSLLREPIEVLSNGMLLANTCALALVALYYLIDLVHYFRWRRRALAAAETGDFVPTARNGRLYLPWVLLAAIAFMIYGVISTGQPRFSRFFLFHSCGLLALLFAVNGVRNLLRRKKVSTDTNRAVTIVVDLVLAGLLAFAVTFDSFHILGDSEPPRDGLMISVEELQGGSSGDVLFDTTRQSSFLLTRYRGWQYPMEREGLSYTIVDVHVNALLDLCLDQLLHAYDERGQSDAAMDPPVYGYDGEPNWSLDAWQADRVWQLRHYGVAEDTYLLQYGSRLAVLELSWTPTQEEMGRAAAILKPAEA